MFWIYDGALIARNPGQQWLTRFDGRGFTVTPAGTGSTAAYEVLVTTTAGCSNGAASGLEVRTELNRIIANVFEQ